ncbi:hypothetical protein JHK86_018031 [Glycine max]|nr:hypothetical protein JHK86_018031 [Glycine max]
MNPSSNNHTVEPKDLGNSSANFNGVNSLQSKVSSEAKLQRVLQSPVMTVNDILEESVERRNGEIPHKLKLSWESIKQDAMKEQKIYSEECNRLGINLKSLVDTAKSYQTVLAENRKLFNEVQELKGYIVDLDHFLLDKRKKQSIVEHIGETDLFVANPAKQGKEALSSTSGPNGATTESLGVNYRALNDLFSISTSRKSSIVYDIGVQIIEIYNEQLMDIGLKNRAKGSTAMNERSSRSHSVVSIHVCGMDKKFGSSLHSNLHLVDLAGSERVDRSKVSSLKDTILVKDEEIEKLQLLKDLKSDYPGVNSENLETTSE